MHKFRAMQKEVKLISLEVKDYQIIRAVKLDFQKWKDTGVIEVIGDMGNGKSSLLEALAMATTGQDHVKDKSLLNMGFKTEVQLSDGDHNIFMGIKVSEFSKGKQKGEPKFETYLYEKDSEGNIDANPIIDGEKATASEYSKLLSTALTFKMSSLFSQDQTEHRKIIESLFSEELKDLGVDAILAEISSLREVRDFKRHERDRAGATMEAFTEMGLDEPQLNNVKYVPTEPITKQISDLEIEAGIMVSNPDKEKQIKLGEIAEKGRKVADSIRELNDILNSKYNSDVLAKEKSEQRYESAIKDLQPLKSLISSEIPEEVKDILKSGLTKWESLIEKPVINQVEKPLIIPIIDGKVNIPMDYDPKYNDMVQNYRNIQKEYIDVLNSTVSVDTSEIDKKISKLKTDLSLANENNVLYDKFHKWVEWTKARIDYEGKIDELRALYGKIDTGVHGLIINPSIKDSGRVEMWMEYNGQHDVDLFKNKKKEYRRLFEYSKSQRAIVGVLLQAARLDKKPKALRLVVLDDYTQTESGKNLLHKVCTEKNLNLVISRTDDRTKITDLKSGQFLIENGEILLNE